MHGSRPDLYQLRQLFLAAVIAAGAIVIVAAVALCSGTSGFSQSAATVIAIANMSVGSPPTDFKFARTGQGGPGKWNVVSDPSSFTGSAIEQSSADRTDFEPIVAKNVEVSIAFKPVAGRVDQAGGIAVRVADA